MEAEEVGDLTSKIQNIDKNMEISNNEVKETEVDSNNGPTTQIVEENKSAETIENMDSQEADHLMPKNNKVEETEMQVNNEENKSAHTEENNSSESVKNVGETTKNAETEGVENVVEANKTAESVETAEKPNKSNESNETVETAEKSNEAVRNVGEANKSNALSLLSHYDSDMCEESTVDSDVELIEDATSTNVKNYRSQVVELTDDSSDDDTSDSDDASDKSKRSFTRLRKVIDKRIAEVSDEDEDDEDADDDEGKKQKKVRNPPKVKGELLLEDLPPIQDLHITVPEEECKELGKVHSIVEQLVLVSVLPNSILLDLDTVLFLDKGKRVLGEVFDVLGQVADPLYCVRFNSNAQIKEKNINVGDLVYVAPKTEYTQYVILSNLMKIRGSDASWENDVEPPPRFLDYSDDEQERMARARMRNKDRQEPIVVEDHQEKRACGEQQNAIVIDDDDTVESTTAATNSRANYAGRGRGRGCGMRNRRNNRGNNRMQNPNQNQNQQPPALNANSWHSNFQMPPFPTYYGNQFQYAMPPPFAMPPPYQMPPSYESHPYALRAPIMPQYMPNMQQPPPPLPPQNPPNNTQR